MAEFYVGLMSGTSLDGIDAVLLDLAEPQPRLLHHYSGLIPPPLRETLLRLCESGDGEIEQLGRADRALATAMAAAVSTLCRQAGVDCAKVTAIGSHGQTIRHRPTSNTQQAEEAFTLQIGDPNTLAELTGITTVADFRRRDIAAGGQGAPLVPAFHAAAFASTERDRIVVNIGGMANLSILPRHGAVSGFDSGPGNVLMDAWIQHHRGLPYDRDGQWAASGRPLPALLHHYLSRPYFSQSGPKSTGREQFNLTDLQATLAPMAAAKPEDVQHSLMLITASSIIDAIKNQSLDQAEIYICGGGAHNKTLLATLARLLPESRVDTTTALGLEPDWVEAAAFAWLAKQALKGLPGNLPAVTGAKGARVLGAIYPA